MITVSGEGRSIHLPDHMAEYLTDLNHDIAMWLCPYDEDVTEFDFTKPRFSKLHDFPFKVWLPSFTESIEELREFVALAELQEGDTVLDCGGFAGLTAFLFCDVVGKSGTVVTLEPDFINFRCLTQNLADYFSLYGRAPIALNGAVWHEDGAISFNADGAMGSSVSTNTAPRGQQTVVPAYSLSTIARGLPKVHHVKLDIEGAEVQALQDDEFWNTHRPTVTIECHNNNEKIVRALLLTLDYEVEPVTQIASFYPMWHARPK